MTHVRRIVALLLLLVVTPEAFAEDERSALDEATRALREAQTRLDELRESKTEKHPAVIGARQRLDTAKRLHAAAEKAYRAKHGGQVPLPTPEATQEQKRRVQHEMAKARLRLLLDKRAVAEEELRKLRMTKTDQHPRVRAAQKRLAELNRLVTTQADRAAACAPTTPATTDDAAGKLAQAAKLLDEAGAPEEAARVRALLEAGTPTAASTTTLDALRAEVQALRADVEELKKLLREALAK